MKLAVTTARAGQGTDVPTLDPFWLEPPQYYPTSYDRSMSAPAAAGAAMDAEMAAPEVYRVEKTVRPR